MIGDKLLYKHNNELFYCEVEREFIEAKQVTVKFYGSKLPKFDNEEDKHSEGYTITDSIDKFYSISDLIRYIVI